MLEAARLNKDIDAIVAETIRRTDLNPETAEEVLGQNYTFIHLADPDQRSLLIARRDPDVSSFEPLFTNIAADLNMGLYDAGSLRSQDAEGRCFTDFASWDKACPLPDSWRRIV